MDQNGYLQKTVHVAPMLVCASVAVDGSQGLSGQTPGGTGILTITYAATGVLRLTMANAGGRCLFADAKILHAAGTYDAQIDWVTNHETSGQFDYAEFQVRKTSDGTALAPASVTVYFQLFLSSSRELP